METKGLSFSTSTISVGWWFTVDNEMHQSDSSSAQDQWTHFSSCLNCSLRMVATQPTHPQNYAQTKPCRSLQPLSRSRTCVHRHKDLGFSFIQDTCQGSESLENLRGLCCSCFFISLCLVLFLHCYDFRTSENPPKHQHKKNLVSESAD